MAGTLGGTAAFTKTTQATAIPKLKLPPSTATDLLKDKAKNIASQNIKKPINTNPFKGNVSSDIMIADVEGNIIFVQKGQHLTGSPNGKWIQVRGSLGNPTGLRKDGPHSLHTHSDIRALQPHAHVPGINNLDGTPWLPIRY